MQIKGKYGRNLVLINYCRLELIVVAGVDGNGLVFICRGYELVRDSGVED